MFFLRFALKEKRTQNKQQRKPQGNKTCKKKTAPKRKPGKTIGSLEKNLNNAENHQHVLRCSRHFFKFPGLFPFLPFWITIFQFFASSFSQFFVSACPSLLLFFCCLLCCFGFSAASINLACIFCVLIALFFAVCPLNILLESLPMVAKRRYILYIYILRKKLKGLY